MNWLNTLITAIATAAFGAAVSGYIANRSVRWYRISSFEGGSGYYVVGLALGGLVAGFIIGLVISRLVAGSAHPSTSAALLYSVATILCIVGVIGGVARLLADIPPTIDGETLMLQLEARWPATRIGSPADTPGVAYLDLRAVTFFRQQGPQRGALWKEDARKSDEGWTVSGAVPLVTARGTPTVDVALNDTERVSFTLPSLAHPTPAASTWTTWFPSDAKDSAARTNGVTYRYRVQKKSEPVRTEHVGDFAVSAVVSYFKPVSSDGLSTIDFYGTFRVTWRDKPISLPGDNIPAGMASVVAKLPGSRPALLVAVNSTTGSSWVLLTEEGGVLREQRIADYTGGTTPAELTNLPERMAETREPRDPRGRVDDLTFARSQRLLFDNAVLNVETHEVHRFTARSTASLIPSVPPLGVSPDGGSFARFVLGSIDSRREYPPLLAVTDFIHDTVYEVPIDQARMPYEKLDELTLEWVARYFTWKPDASGTDRLVAR